MLATTVNAPRPIACMPTPLGYRVTVTRPRYHVLANNSLQLTRLACGKLEMPCPPECARMGGALPEPPGS